MMNYETFKEIFMKELRETNPETSLEFHTVYKTNKTYDGIRIADAEISPVISCEIMYATYIKKGSIAAAVAEACKILKAEPFVFSVPEFNIRKVMPYLMNYNKNKERLKDIPHRRMLDLVLVYRQIVMEDKEGISSFIIDNKMIKEAGITEQMLFGYLSKKHEPFFIRNLSEFTGMSGEIPLMIVTNEKLLNGAVCMLYEDVLEKIAKEAGGNFYIIPSSIHEILVVSEAGIPDKNILKEIIPKVNSTAVIDTEVLSDSLYYYDVGLNRIFIVK